MQHITMGLVPALLLIFGAVSACKTIQQQNSVKDNLGFTGEANTEFIASCGNGNLSIASLEPASISAKDTQFALDGDLEGVQSYLQGRMKALCADCHDGAPERRFDVNASFSDWVRVGLIKPGDLAGSILWQQVANDSMPPKADGYDPVPEGDKNLLKLVILSSQGDQGAPTVQYGNAVAVSERDILSCIQRDLQLLEAKYPSDREARRHFRYFSLAHLVALYGKWDSTAIQQGRIALTKLVNSLSRKGRIAPPLVVDQKYGLIFRVDLRAYGWSRELWDKFVALSPYSAVVSPDEFSGVSLIATALDTKVPYLRADWFMNEAGRAPLYYEILQLPDNEVELERDVLGVNLADSIVSNEAIRAYLNQGTSEVSTRRNNRLVERHNSRQGAYWKSYDFLENSGLSNIFVNPFGPCIRTRDYQDQGFLIGCDNAKATFEKKHVFAQDGGEFIFSLENGLHGYYITDADGNSVDAADTALVVNKRPVRVDPTGQVISGISCMGCHNGGLLQVANDFAAVARPYEFSDVKDRKSLQALGRNTIAQYIKQDSEEFRAAMSKTLTELQRAGFTTSVEAAGEPLIVLASTYPDQSVNIAIAASELGLSARDFDRHFGELLSRIQRTGHGYSSQAVETVEKIEPLKRGGNVPRRDFEVAFPLLLEEFGIGSPAFERFQRDYRVSGHGDGDRPVKVEEPTYRLVDNICNSGVKKYCQYRVTKSSTYSGFISYMKNCDCDKDLSHSDVVGLLRSYEQDYKLRPSDPSQFEICTSCQ